MSLQAKKLTSAQQRSLLRALPTTRKNACKKHCQACQMKGSGIKDILKSIGNVLGPIAKEIGPTVMKEFILPMLLKKLKGEGRGSGLRLAGQRGTGGSLRSRNTSKCVHKIGGKGLRLAGKRK